MEAERRFASDVEVIRFYVESLYNAQRELVSGFSGSIEGVVVYWGILARHGLPDASIRQVYAKACQGETLTPEFVGLMASVNRE